MTEGEFGRRLLVAVDTESYGRRDDQRMASAQRSLQAVLDEAGAAARLGRSDWQKQYAGDSEFAVLPAEESEPRVVDDFVRKLAVALQAHNRDLRRERRLRLRLAVHYGTAIAEANGFSGQGPVQIHRLLGSRVLHEALADSGRSLAVVYSRPIFQDVIKQGHTSISVRELVKVRVQEKEFSQDAWLWLPEGPGAGNSEGRRPPPGGKPPGERPSRGGRIDARGSHFTGSVIANNVGGVYTTDGGAHPQATRADDVGKAPRREEDSGASP